MTVVFQAPVLSGLPAFATITEDTTENLVLGSINITDRDNSTWNEKAQLSVTPSNSNISLQFHSYDSKTLEFSYVTLKFQN